MTTTSYDRYLLFRTREETKQRFHREKKDIDLRQFVARDLGRPPQRPAVHDWLFCCPFHSDATPSLSVSAEFFYCHGCAAKGDIATYVAMRDHLDIIRDFEEVVARIVGHITLSPLPKIQQVTKVAARKLTMGMVDVDHKRFDKIIPWLIDRAIAVPIAREHKLGLSSGTARYYLKGGRVLNFIDNRYSIPEVRGDKVIFIQRRRQDKEAREQLTRFKLENNDLYMEMVDDIMEGVPPTEDSELIIKRVINTIWGPKYKGVQPHFNGIYNAGYLIPPLNSYGKVPDVVAAFVVEGPLDALALLSAGYGAVAVPRNDKLDLKRAFEHVIQPIAMFDRDEAGAAHAEWFKAKIKAAFPDLPFIPDTRPQIDGQDPNDICIAGKIDKHMADFGFHNWL